jgi:hypothetical protein
MSEACRIEQYDVWLKLKIDLLWKYLDFINVNYWACYSFYFMNTRIKISYLVTCFRKKEELISCKLEAEKSAVEIKKIKGSWKASLYCLRKSPQTHFNFFPPEKKYEDTKQERY